MVLQVRSWGQTCAGALGPIGMIDSKMVAVIKGWGVGPNGSFLDEKTMQ